MEYPERIPRTKRGLLPANKAPKCHVCGMPILSVAEARIGVHIACVQEQKQKVSKVLPRARYGTRRL